MQTPNGWIHGDSVRCTRARYLSRATAAIVVVEQVKPIRSGNDYLSLCGSISRPGTTECVIEHTLMDEV